MKKIISIILTIVMISAIVMTIPFGTFAVEQANAVASIGTTYYESLDAAIDAAQDGDVIVLLKDITATSKLIEGKKITIKGEGTTKPVITAGSGKGAFWVRGDVTFENISFKNFASKNVIFYGTQDAPDTNDYKITIDNCEFEFSASGAIYGYNCNKAEIVVTNSKFTSLTSAAAHSPINTSVAPAEATYTKFENVTLVGCGQYINTGAKGVFKTLSGLKAYDEAEAGELLYTVNFNGDTSFTPGRTTADSAQMDYTVVENGAGVKITNKTGATNAKTNLWGGLIKELEATNETIYSMVYKAKADGKIGSNNSVAVGGWAVSEAAFQTTAGIYNNYSSYNTLTSTDGTDKQRASLSNGITKIEGYVYFDSVDDYEIDDDGFMTVLVVYDGTTKTFANYILKDGATDLNAEANWIKLEEKPMANALNGTDTNYMCFWTYAYYNTINTTIKDVQFYKEFLWPTPVAGVTVNGGATTEYYDFDTLFTATNRVVGDVEVTIYKDVTFDKAIVICEGEKLTIKAADGVTPTLTVSVSKANPTAAYKGGFVFASGGEKIAFKDVNIVVEEATVTNDATRTTSLVMLNGGNHDKIWGNGAKQDIIFDNVNVTSAGDIINQHATTEELNGYITVKDSTITATGDFINASRSTKGANQAFNLTVTGGATFNVAKMYRAPANATEEYITYAKKASVTVDGATSYYDTLEEALADVKTNNLANATIVVFGDQSVAETTADFAYNNLTIKGVSENVTITLAKKAFFVKDDAAVTFADLKIKFSAGDAIYADFGTIDLTFNNVDFSMSGNYTIEVCNTVTSASFTFVDCTVNYTDPTFVSGSPAYFMYLGKVQSTVIISNMETNVPVVKATSTPAITYVITGINNVTFGTENNVGLFIAGENDIGIVSKTYGDDATAKQFGYAFRVGDTVGGKVGEVYFATKAEAFAVALTTAKVYDITDATPAEATCDHTYTDTVVPPTCTVDGYTTHTCGICGYSYNDTTVTASHKYSAATCTAKAKCSVCGDETGDLADHVDADNNYKCDECDAACGEAPATTEATTTTAPTTKAPETTAAAEEEKGCGGTVTVVGLALVASLGTCAIFVEKKRK